MKRLVERDKNFMNTLITIKVIQDKSSTVKVNQAIEDAFGEFDRIVKKYTRFNEDSELSNLNRQRGNWVKVSEEFFYLIEYMLEMSKKTNGAFDPTIIDFLEVYGYDKNYDFSKLDRPELDSLVKKIAKERKNWEHTDLDKKTLRVRLHNNQKIDLGGIGKGYAIDCAYKKLEEVESNFLINAGGDIRAKGKNLKGEWWSTGLKIREEEKLVGKIELKNQSLACSGSWARKVKQFHHIINPVTGKPVEKNYNTVFVIADTATESDAWATALFVGGEDIVKNKEINFKYLFY